MTVALEEETRKLLAAKCRDLWARYGVPDGSAGIHQLSALPYAIEFNTEFLEDYSLSAVGPGTGFTCSTFVMAILALCGVRLFQMDDWQLRDDDEAWQDWVVAELSKWLATGRITQPEIDALRASRGTLRFRSTDVAAAATTLGDHPLPFAEVDQMRQTLEAEILRLLPPQ